MVLFLATNTRRSLWAVGLLAALAVLIACSSSSTSATNSNEDSAGPKARVLSSDLSPGENRVTFIVIDEKNEPIRVSQASIDVYYVGSNEGSPGELKQSAQATFRQWPIGDAGIYTARLDLDTAGRWRAEVMLAQDDGSQVEAQGIFNVASKSSTPAIGDPAPASENRTAEDVSSLSELTTAEVPDPELYEMTIAEAVKAGQPLVLVFATPAYCTSRTCGPQVEEVEKLKASYDDRVNFVHIEIYENPREIQGDLSKAKLAPAVREWGLPNEPWTFVVDANGRVADKFEAFSTAEELETSLLKVLGQ